MGSLLQVKDNRKPPQRRNVTGLQTKNPPDLSSFRVPNFDIIRESDFRGASHGNGAVRHRRSNVFTNVSPA